MQAELPPKAGDCPREAVPFSQKLTHGILATVKFERIKQQDEGCSVWFFPSSPYSLCSLQPGNKPRALEVKTCFWSCKFRCLQGPQKYFKCQRQSSVYHLKAFRFKLKNIPSIPMIACMSLVLFASFGFTLQAVPRMGALAKGLRGSVRNRRDTALYVLSGYMEPSLWATGGQKNHSASNGYLREMERKSLPYGLHNNSLLLRKAQWLLAWNCIEDSEHNENSQGKQNV